MKREPSWWILETGLKGSCMSDLWEIELPKSNWSYISSRYEDGWKPDVDFMDMQAGDGDPGSGQFTFKQDQGGGGHYVIIKMIPYKFSNYWRSPMSGNFLPYCYQISARTGSIPRTHFRKKAQRNCFWIIITKG
jgi:hypothetical protein